MKGRGGFVVEVELTDGGALAVVEAGEAGAQRGSGGFVVEVQGVMPGVAWLKLKGRGGVSLLKLKGYGGFRC